ncbi:MAG: HAMP domain-containing histidine kinase [SAR202 cluster bacterium]|nr:HAMP domain-containing histidine kinase [SAR202 cluster bacterium]
MFHFTRRPTIKAFVVGGLAFSGWIAVAFSLAQANSSREFFIAAGQRAFLGVVHVFVAAVALVVLNRLFAARVLARERMRDRLIWYGLLLLVAGVVASLVREGLSQALGLLPPGVANRWTVLVILALSTVGVGLIIGLFSGFSERIRDLRRFEDYKAAVLQSVAHQFYSPLTAIKASADLLSETDILQDEVGRRRAVAAMGRGLDRLEHLVAQSLAYAQVVPPESHGPTVAHIKAAFGQVQEAISPLLLAGDLTLSAQIPEALPPVRVKPNDLEAVLGNLLDNAAKYSFAGQSVMLRARAFDGVVQCKVSNVGPFIDEADERRIFEPYYRGRAANRAEVRGAGLGLAIVKKIVETNGGQVGVRRAPQPPTTLWFTLPVGSKG